MPTFERSPAELVERFGTILDRFPEAQRRKMFGYPAAFVGGNLATGLFADTWMIRLSEEDLAAAKAIGGTDFSPMAGRQMRGYVVLPAAVVADDPAIEGWVRRSLDHTATLPAKAKAKATSRPKATSEPKAKGG